MAEPDASPYKFANLLAERRNMDNDSPESKEIDEALLAQCTCGGIKRCLPCTATCAIFAALFKPELGEPFNTGTAIADNDPYEQAVTLLDTAQRYIAGMGGHVELSETNIDLLQRALREVHTLRQLNKVRLRELNKGRLRELEYHRAFIELVKSWRNSMART